MSSPGEKGASGEIREANLGELLHYKYLLGLAMSEALPGELTYGKVQTNKTELRSQKGGKSTLRKPYQESKQTEGALGRAILWECEEQSQTELTRSDEGERQVRDWLFYSKSLVLFGSYRGKSSQAILRGITHQAGPGTGRIINLGMLVEPLPSTQEALGSISSTRNK